MCQNQQVPFVVLSQPGQEDEMHDDVSGLESVAPKVSIRRRNSAPQAQNRFSAGKLKPKSKDCGKSKDSPKRHLPTGEQNIPTLSCELVHVNQPQAAEAAANILVSHRSKQEPLPSVGHSLCESKSPVSPALLHDSNHTPTLTSFVYESDPKPDHVWQLREHYSVAGRSSSIDCDSAGNVLENFASLGCDEGVYPGNSSCPDSKRGSHLLYNGSSGKTVPNGATETSNGHMTGQVASVDEDGRMSSTSSVKSMEPSVDLRSSQHRYPFRQIHSEIIAASEMHRKMSLVNMKERGYARLEEELLKAQKALEMKDEEVDELRGIREQLMKEVSDFTAALFEEVNSQLNEAAISEQHAKKQLKEANAKIEVLIAEVAALKDLVLTSTPSSPNKHLHPQIDTSAKKEKGGKPFWKTHRRSTSHHQYTKESREKAEATEHHSQLKELDTVAFDEFSRWRLQPTMEFTGQFFARVQHEDIQPCLNFKNTKLAKKLEESVNSNTLSIEPIPGDHSFPRKCSLSETHKLCNYKIKFEGDDEWHSISQMSRNRIAAVCDFYSYLRYIVQGLVKCSDKDMYAEIVRLRSQMALARLGLI